MHFCSNSRPRFRATCFSIALLLVSVHLALAESALVSGRILDPQGAPVVGAHLKLVSAGSIVGPEVISDADGMFALRNVESGLYQVQADFPSFVSVTNDMR